VAAVVLDAAGIADLLEHLEIVAGALLDTLRFQVHLLLAEIGQPLFQLILDVDDRLAELSLVGDELLGGEDFDPDMFGEDFAGQGIELTDALNLIAPEFDRVCGLGIGGDDL
jgi:hypothetical protein